MAGRDDLESRVDEIERSLRLLIQQVEQLVSRQERPVSALPPSGATVHAATPAPEDESLFPEPAEVSDEILSWARKAALLPRLSTLCFLLVVALVLRTITDNDIIDKLLGSALGMGYAAVLMVAGWYAYRKANLLAPVFAACGAVLMSTIVVETHTRFQSLPLVPAYMTLMATGAAMVIISYQFNAFLPISLGTLGLCLAGVAIDYPNPFFPYLAMVLWTANILGYFAARLKRCSWLRWTVLLVTMVMLHLWGYKLVQALVGKVTPPDSLALAWFIPVLAVFAATYQGLALLGILRSAADRVSRFDMSLPTVGTAFAYAIVSYVMSAWGANMFILGWIGAAGAASQFAMAFWLARRRTTGESGTNAFVASGAVLLAMALPGATGSYLLSLPAVAAVAFFLAIMSRSWGNGAVRASSYLLQIYACVALALVLRKGTAGLDALTVIPAGLLAVIGLLHYRWCRLWAPPATSAYFSYIDRRDAGAVLLFLGALVSGFFMLRTAVHLLLATMPGNVDNSFRCAQSIIINIAAAGLMVFAMRRNNKEIRNVAILVTLIGAVKVFLYDMMGTHGVPLVLSVFSFGLAAALESLALGRWPRVSSDGEGADKDSFHPPSNE